MQSQIVNQLQLASPSEVVKFTGIHNWEMKSQSYTKILYNNTLLPYDNHSVYFLDKLHLTLISLNEKWCYNYSRLFKSKKQFKVNEWLTIIPDNRRQSNYYYSFSIAVEGSHFGKLNFFHTRNNRNCLIEIDNEVLYCQTMSWIIASVFVVSKTFGLCFNNISVAEIARDTNENVYEQLTKVYYQSTHCSDMVHQLNGDKRYFKSVTKCWLDDSPDENDPAEGVFRIGKSTSNSFLKAYNKTKEIEDKGRKKQYIQQHHDNLLDPNKDVYRVEMTANSGAFTGGGVFGKKDVDLLYMLDKNNLGCLFYALLGDKLVFKDLRTKRWVNGNDEYDRISIIEQPPLFKTRQIPPKPIVRKYTHDKNINHLKQMINRYLDRKIGFSSLVDYAIREMRENVNFAVEFRSALNKVQVTHKNEIQKQDQKRLEKLCSALRKNMKKRNAIGWHVAFSLLL